MVARVDGRLCGFLSWSAGKMQAGQNRGGGGLGMDGVAVQGSIEGIEVARERPNRVIEVGKCNISAQLFAKCSEPRWK